MIKLNKGKFLRSLLLLTSFVLFCCFSGCGGSKDGDTTPGTDTTTASAASLDLAASPTSIKTDGSTTSTITVNALNSANATLSGVVVTLSTDTGILSAPTVTTPGTVTLSCGGNKANRTATITATAGSVTSQIPVQIVGSTVTLTSSASSLPLDSTTEVNLTVTAKDAASATVAAGTAVTLTQTGTGSVILGATSGSTNASGQFITTAMGSTIGDVTITATALGATATTSLSIGSTASTFAIESLSLNGGASYKTNPTAMKINSDTLDVTVNAPGVTTVTFATTIGLWNATNKVLDVTVAGGKATAQLTTSLAGIANVQVFNKANPNTSDTLTVAMSSGAAANRIVLQAAPTILPLSVGTTTGSSTLTATVYDVLNNPLSGQPVAFSIVDGTSTSGGETVSPVVVMTATTSSGGLSVGQARATFTSGSMPSSGTGVKVRAYVVGTTAPEVRTGLSPSGIDAAIVIGGVAGSIAFGMDSKAAEDSTGANYVYKMSVLVADANGNPVSGAVVNLGIWPVAWCTGSGCTCDPDTATTGTFWNEDRNENLFLDSTPAPQEDGARCYYANATKCSGGGWLSGGKVDILITPTNSAGGTVPASVTTDANGVAGFTVTYPKSSGMWIYDRIRATTIVQGSETRAEIIIYLRIVVGEEAICAFSPFFF